MPLALIIIAAGLILAGVRGSYSQLGNLLKKDFTGDDNFLNWLCAIGIVGCVGYVPALQRWSRLFIGLIMLAMFLKQGDGLFSQFVSAVQGATAGTPNYSPGNPNAQSSGDSGIVGSVLGALGIQMPNIPSIGSQIPKSPVTVPGLPNPVAAPGAGTSPSINGFVNP